MTGPVVAYWKVLGWTEDFWESFCEQQRLIAEGVQPDAGLVKTAKEWGVTVVELQHLILESGLLMDEGDRRSKLANRMLAVSEMAVDMMFEKMMDQGEVAKTALRDAGLIARSMSDASLNLKNGTAAPSITINMQEVKAIIALNREMGDTYVPLKLNGNKPALHEAVPQKDHACQP